MGELWNEAIASELRASLSAEYNYEQGTYVITREEAMCAIVPALDALAGLNPAALGELLAACDQILRDGLDEYMAGGLEDALAKLRGTGGGAASRERCRAGSDGDCYWAECPQEANNRENYQQWCPLAEPASQEVQP